MPDKRWRGRWELRNFQIWKNTLKSKSIKTFEIVKFQFPRQFLRVSLLSSPLLSFPFLCLVNWTQDVPARDGGQLRVLRPPHQAAPQRAPAVEPEWSQAGAGQTCQADGRQSSHSQQAWGRPGLVSAQDGVRHRLCGQEEVPARLHWRSQDEGLHLC